LWRLTNRSKLNTYFRIKLPMIDIRTFHYVILIIKSHYSILLLSDLLLSKVVATFTIIPGHLKIVSSSLRWLVVLLVKWGNVSTTICCLFVVIHTPVLTISTFFSKTISLPLSRIHILLLLTIMITLRSIAWIFTILATLKLYFLIF